MVLCFICSYCIWSRRWTGTQQLWIRSFEALTTVLDAIFWISNSWKEVEQLTIEKCFKRCGFCEKPTDSSDSSDNPDVGDNDDDDDVPLAGLKLSKEVFGASFKELTQIDNDICTTSDSVNFDMAASEIIEQFQSSQEGDSDSDETHVQPITNSKGSEMLEKLKNLAKNLGSTTMLECLCKAEEAFNEHIVTGECRQSLNE